MTNDHSSQSDSSVKNYIASLDEQTVKDCHVLIEMMQRISGHEPKMWNVATIGFDTYHYKYDSGREGDGHIIGFYPRKGKITVYLMDGTVRYAALLAQLGRHSATGYCVYIRRLSDVELPILEQIVQKSYEYVKSQDGHIHQKNYGELHKNRLAAQRAVCGTTRAATRLPASFTTQTSCLVALQSITICTDRAASFGAEVISVGRKDAG